jgi:hypothetical protein
MLSRPIGMSIHLLASYWNGVSAATESRPDMRPWEPTAISSLSRGCGPSLRSDTMSGATPKLLASAYTTCQYQHRSYRLRAYARIGHIMEAGITSFNILYRTSIRQRTGDGLSGGNGLRGEWLWGMLEHGMQVRIVTRRRLHVRGRGIRGSTWAGIIGRHRRVARRDHVWSWRNIRIAFGRGAAT